MEPASFRHRVATFAAEANAIAPVVTLGFSRRVGSNRTSFTYWHPLGLGTHVVTDAESALEPHFQFFGAARVVTMPAPSAAEPTAVAFGLRSPEPLSETQS